VFALFSNMLACYKGPQSPGGVSQHSVEGRLSVASRQPIMAQQGFFCTIQDPHSVITAIDSGIRFPDVVTVMRSKYEADIRLFAELIRQSSSSGDLLARIRTPAIPAPRRMALLKMFRRCVSGVCDTEATKKITTISTQSFIDAYGHTFTPITKLKQQFAALTPEIITALAVLVGEYDNRGQQGYVLTGLFFDWFEDSFKNQLTIEGPRGSGPDIELSTVLPGFVGGCPCDFVIRQADDRQLKAVGFARYDSTRGGAQSDDRTGGNSGKVYNIRQCCLTQKVNLKVIFLADGPGLTHRDTWKEACDLDCVWDDNVRVTTLKTAPQRITADWLLAR